MFKTAFAVTGVVLMGWAGSRQPAPGQEPKRDQTEVISAADLGKEFAADTLEPVTKYQGKKIRITGRVTMAYEPFVYLGTGFKFPTGQPVLITLDYTNLRLPNVSAGDLVVAEGVFDRKGVFGPTLVKCNLMPAAAKNAAVGTGMSKPSATARPATKGARTPRKGAARETGPGAPFDPRAVILRFDGPVVEGDLGWRPGWSSFRLRLGPGNWRGTTFGASDAWGDGNGGKDHWGIGSGEKTACSRLFEDQDGHFFIFSVSGTRWDSNWIAAMFRLTLADGQPGIAIALFPCR